MTTRWEPVLGLVVICALVTGMIHWERSQNPQAIQVHYPKPQITSHTAKQIRKTPRPTPKVTHTPRPQYTSRTHTRTIAPHTPAMRYAITQVPATQWACLAILWQRESGWSPTSDNPTSSAYGIPQILGLPASLTPNEQVNRGLSYIRHRYGTPCHAWAFWQTHRWY